MQWEKYIMSEATSKIDREVAERKNWTTGILASSSD
jgi:hypothetical protein